MLKLEQLETFRTLEDMNAFYNETQKFQENTSKLLKESKDKKIMNRKLLEEYFLLLNYASIAFKGQNVKCRYACKLNQEEGKEYNGEVLFSDGRLENIRIVVPGVEETENKCKLDSNDNRLMKPIACNLEQQWEEIRESILFTAIKTSKQNNKNIIIVIAIDCYNFILASKNTTLRKYFLKKIQELVNDLRTIKYSAKNVCLLISSFENAYKGEIITIL